MKEVTKENFDEIVITPGQPVIVDFWAPWCGPCRTVGPILEEIYVERQDVEIVKCNVDDSPELTKRFNIKAIPTVIFFNEGKVQEILVGAVPKSAYEAKITKLYS